MVQRLGYYGQGLGRVMNVHSGGVYRFEDLLAWRKARDLAREVYEITRGRDFRRDFALRDQIRRAAVSIMSNIAEGFERARRAEFHQFLSIAKGSCAEVRSQLYVAFDAGYLDQRDFDRLLALAGEVARVTGGLRAAVYRQRSPRLPRTKTT